MPKRSKRRSVTSEAGVTRRFRRALEHHEAGELARAAEGYEAVVARAPQWAEAWHAFGVLELQAGEPARAARRLRRATELAPARADYLSNLGAALEASDDLPGAQAVYARALALEPDALETLFNAGLVQARLRAHREARALFERAAALAPADCEVWLNLARACLELGDLAAARDACVRGLEAAGTGDAAGAAALHAQLGAVARAAGVLEEAARHYEAALALFPSGAPILASLGAVQHELGRLADAEARYRRALEVNPNLLEVQLNLARLYRAQGHLEASYRCLRQALRIAPGHAGARRALVSVLRHAHPASWDPELFSLLVRCYQEREVDPDDLARAAAAQLAAHPDAPARRLADDRECEVLLTGGGLRPLLLPFLSRSINLDSVWEAVLRGWREWLGGWLDAGGEPDDAGIDLLAAFGEQAFANEYVWRESAAELARTEAAATTLATALTAPEHPGEPVVGLALRVALYRDLARVPGIDALASADLRAHPALARLVRRSVLEPAAERSLAGTLPKLGAIEDATSRAVRRQYEEHPYPRWTELPRSGRTHLRELLRRRFPGLDVEGLTRPFRVLVAGCGTGQEPLRIALGCPESEVVGLDLSLASLGYAARMRDTLGVDNLRLLHGDLLSVGALEGRFEVVVANGVLHHMADPVAGWRSLVGVLAPHGLMKVGLYSERARSAVVRARSLAAARGLCGGRLEDVRALRALILSGEVPDLAELAESEDFYSTSACRDLLLHACEHRFTLPEIAHQAEVLELEVVGLELADGLAQTRFEDTDPALPVLERWRRVEEHHPETFTGMYQLWFRARR